MLENIRLKLVSKEDLPQGQAINKSQLHSSNFDFGSEPDKEGSLISVQSIFTDTDDNSYERIEKTLFYFEQTTFIEFDNNFLAQFIQYSIKNHAKDLGLDESKFEIPSIGVILLSVENS